MELRELLAASHPKAKSTLTLELKEAIGSYLTKHHKIFDNAAIEEIAWNDILYAAKSAKVKKAERRAGVITIYWSKRIQYFTRSNWKKGGSSRAPKE